MRAGISSCFAYQFSSRLRCGQPCSNVMMVLGKWPFGGAFDVMEGHARDRNVVVEFSDRATAKACYEYQAAKLVRQKYADADFIIIEGPDSGPF
jgi:hypothetical protein